jgi:trimeric autotransporter adhesin
VALATTAGYAQCTPGWIPLPPNNAPNHFVYALQTMDPDGSGPRRPMLYLAGNFTQVGSRAAAYLAYWNGHETVQLDGGANATSLMLALFTPPAPKPPQLIAGGVFHFAGLVQSRAVVGWIDGWQSMAGLSDTSGSFFYPRIYSAAQLGDELFVSGWFDRVNGEPANNTAAWNGTQWRVVASGRVADDLHVHNGHLYAAGFFGVPGAPHLRTGVLRWTGADWVTVGTGYPDDCFALTTWQGMLTCGGLDLYGTWNGITAWNGQQWLQLGGGVNGVVKALATFDPDGAGPLPEMLFAGGGFGSAGGLPASGIAAWDGISWRALGDGVDGTVEALEVYENQLYVGGRFLNAGGMSSPRFARWGCPQPPPPPPCYANCDQSTVAPILNVDDFTCFINGFAAARALQPFQQVGHWANCDQSTTPPVLNIDDFTCFINRFAAGCN